MSLFFRKEPAAGSGDNHKNDGTRRVIAFLSGLSILHCHQNPLTHFRFSFWRTGSYLFFYSIGCTSASSMKNEFSSCGERCGLKYDGIVL